MALKQLFLGQRELQRRIAELQGGGARTASSCFGPYAAAEPRVSVVLTVYNYEDVVGRGDPQRRAERRTATTSWWSSTTPRPTARRTSIRAALAQHPWLPARLICRGRNGGLPAARNLAAEHARGEYVFVLDADNYVYPHALGRLADALDADPEAAFAYGILEVFTSTGPDRPEELAGLGPAAPALRQLRGRDGDDPALGARGGRRLLGGPAPLRMGGLRALVRAGRPRAAAASTCRRSSPRYRSSIGSMIALTDIDASAAWSALLERYAVLHG